HHLAHTKNAVFRNCQSTLCTNMGIDSLWFDIDAPVIAPPTVTREQTLPFGSLTWENFERLCFRLAHRSGDVEDARIYGEPGQAQEGIDLYVRRATGDYATWQCKRYEEVTITDLKDAVTKFLEGDWAARTKLFRLAVRCRHGGRDEFQSLTSIIFYAWL